MSNKAEDIRPILDLYGKRKHPLEYKNRYQLLVMVILAAQTSDKQVNKIAPAFFEIFPSLSSLKKKDPEDIYSLISSVRGFRKKAKWIIDIAKVTADDAKIPRTMEGLTSLPGLGRKSANIIIRESGDEPEGIMVDLHVVRVAPRIGLSGSENPDKIEKVLMEIFPLEQWNDIGIALSYHGREICRPEPECERCPVSQVCDYYNTIGVNKKKNG
jgi:endonuclease III